MENLSNSSDVFQNFGAFDTGSRKCRYCNHNTLSDLRGTPVCLFHLVSVEKPATGTDKKIDSEEIFTKDDIIFVLSEKTKQIPKEREGEPSAVLIINTHRVYVESKKVMKM